MCGRYTLFVDQSTLEERFDARFEAPFVPRYNAAPGQSLPVIRDVDPETIETLEWGLVPSWADDDRAAPINARAETLAERPTFREAAPGAGDDAATAGRCLVLADGFYEWTETADGKRPYRITFEDDRPFAMAGLWSRWEPKTTQVDLSAFGGADGGGAASTDAEDASLETFAVVTTEPNGLVADYHDRMAAILTPAAEDEWLSAGDPTATLERQPRPASGLRVDPVSTAVNDPTVDEPSLVDPIDR